MDVYNDLEQFLKGVFEQNRKSDNEMEILISLIASTITIEEYRINKNEVYNKGKEKIAPNALIEAPSRVESYYSPLLKRNGEEYGEINNEFTKAISLLLMYKITRMNKAIKQSKAQENNSAENHEVFDKLKEVIEMIGIMWDNLRENKNSP